MPLFEQHGTAAQVRHARFETYAGTKRHLFEDEAEHLAFENLGIFGSVSFLESGFDRFGDLQNRLEFVNVDVRKRQKVS